MDIIDRYIEYKNLLQERKYEEAFKIYNEIMQHFTREYEELKEYLWRAALEESSFKNAGSYF